MIVRELITLLGFQVDKRGEDNANKTFSGLKKAAGALAAVFVTGVIGRGLREMVELAGDAEETASQLDATFGDLSQSVRDFSETTATQVGRSRFEIERFAASTGAIVKPILGSADAAAEMSKSVAGLSVDLASFFNTADTDALRALQAGLVGQSEPLRRFGVVLLQSSLAAFAQEEGITKSLKAMTEAEKVALRFRFIMSQTADAQGDAARTAGSFTNLSRALGAALDELRTEIGKELLPAATALVRTMLVLVREFKGPVITAVRLIQRAMSALSRPLPAIATAVLGLASAFAVFGTSATLAWLAATAPALLAIAVFGLVAAAIVLIIDDLEEMGAGGESVIGTLITGFNDLLETTGSLAESVKEVLVTAFEFWAKKAGLSMEEITELIDEVNGGVNEAIANMERFGRFVGEAGRFVTDVTGAGIVGRTVNQLAGGGGTTVGGSTVNVTVVPRPGESTESVARRTGQEAGVGVDRAMRRTAQQLAVGGGG